MLVTRPTAMGTEGAQVQTRFMHVQAESSCSQEMLEVNYEVYSNVYSRDLNSLGEEVAYYLEADEVENSTKAEQTFIRGLSDIFSLMITSYVSTILS
jgi:hypothetical protein